ncbi:MAG: hypothetical protein IPM55_17830 [Acidobacteria bacterium]|nr:hypothetical protein [Acidobacteriota bacterium]
MVATHEQADQGRIRILPGRDLHPPADQHFQPSEQHDPEDKDLPQCGRLCLDWIYANGVTDQQHQQGNVNNLCFQNKFLPPYACGTDQRNQALAVL